MRGEQQKENEIMAIIWQAWEQDGPTGYSLVSHLRSDSPQGKNQFLVQEWIEHQQVHPKVVLITKGRTDNQSHWEHIVWCKPGHEIIC